MLSLTSDIATDKITGDAMPAISQAVVVTRGGARKIRITLKEDGEKRPLAAGEYLRVIFNGAKTFDADPCAFSADLTIADLVTDETNVYEVTVSYYTDGLNELLGIDGSTGNDKPTADLLGGIILFSAADAEMATSENFAITFNNNTARADVDVPDPIIAGAAVRYFSDITGLTGGGSTKLDGIATLNRTARELTFPASADSSSEIEIAVPVGYSQIFLSNIKAIIPWIT